MPDYRRARLDGSVYFFTVVLADRSSTLLVSEIDRLRHAYRAVQGRHPFETIAICVLPDHIHAVWSLPSGDSDFSRRWNLIKSGFSRGLEAQPRSPSKIAKREKGGPVKHGYVSRVVGWPHSSFHRYVERDLPPRDWGGDMKDIKGSFGE